VVHFPVLVTTGLDPVVHAEAPQMTKRNCKRHRRMDCRVKPGNDDMRNRSRGASLRPSFAGGYGTDGQKISPNKEGEAERREAHPTSEAAHCRSAAARFGESALAFRRSTAALLAGAFQQTDDAASGRASRIRRNGKDAGVNRGAARA